MRCVELAVVLKGYTSRDFSYGLLNWPVGAHPFRRIEEVERAIREWFRMYESDSYRDGVFKLLTKEHIMLCGGLG